MQLNVKGKLRKWDRPVVMGILNLTDDSFHADSRVAVSEVAERASEMAAAGADIVDLGACSARPGSQPVDEQTELKRIVPAVMAVRERLAQTDTLISVDTFRSTVARAAVEAGAHIVNDISGGQQDQRMFETVASLKVPYVLMHMRGTPATMASCTIYEDMIAEIFRYFAERIDSLHQAGVADVIIDPGFGFAKDIEQNYALFANLATFKLLGCPILAGLSRKSMIYRELGIEPAEALNGTTALNMAALLAGADILRVHDVCEAAQTVRLFKAIERNRILDSRIISITDR